MIFDDNFDIVAKRDKALIACHAVHDDVGLAGIDVAVEAKDVPAAVVHAVEYGELVDAYLDFESVCGVGILV